MDEKAERSIFKTPECLNVIHDLIVFDSKDYSISKKDITLYAICIGWNNETYKQFLDENKLTMKQIDWLRLLHKQFNKLRANQMNIPKG